MPSSVTLTRLPPVTTRDCQTDVRLPILTVSDQRTLTCLALSTTQDCQTDVRLPLPTTQDRQTDVRLPLRTVANCWQYVGYVKNNVSGSHGLI